MGASMTATGGRATGGTAWAAVQVCLTAAAVVPSVLAYRDFFVTSTFLPPVLAALVGAALLAFVASWRRWSTLAVTAGGLGGFAVLTSVAALAHGAQLGQPVRTTTVEAARGLVTGWARMLSIGLPAEPDTRMLTTVLLLTWTASLVSGLLALRTARPLAPVLPPLLAFGTALVMVASGGNGHPWLAAGLTLAAGALMLIRARLRAATIRAPERGERQARTAWESAALLLGVPVVGLMVLVSTGAVQALMPAAGERRADPRPLHPYGLRHPELLSPLATVRSQLDEKPARTLLSVRVPEGQASPRAELLRTAALDTFDGALWTVHESHLLAGRRLPDSNPDSIAPAYALRVTIESLPGPYLPVAGWPTRVELADPRGVQIGYSDESGTLVADTDSGRLDGVTYTLVGRGAAATDVDSAETPSRSLDFTRYTELPTEGLPPHLLALAHRLTDVEPTAIGKLSALETYLRSLPYDLAAPPGHSYAAISRMLGPVHARDADGHAEQHASAFAVLARLLGFPARVAVGYRLGAGGGVRIVTTREAHAWAEVRFDQHGWVAFDPTDPHRSPRSARVIPTAVPTPTSAKTARPAPTPSVELSPPPPSPPPPPAPPPPLREILAGVAGVGTGSVVGLAAFKALRRRRRRRARTSPVRVIGAWHEAVDRLTEQRIPTPEALTAAEIANQAEAKLGDRARALPELAALATRAIFGAAHLAPDAAAHAWHLERDFRRDLVRGWAAPRRLHIWFSPRPLIVAARACRQRRISRKQRRRS
jgi:transglutaminase-like putative cysteine protease